MSREEFEAWYISKFLRIMTDAEAVVVGLRNQRGGYDDHHIDGAWEGYKKWARRGKGIGFWYVVVVYILVILVVQICL